MHGSHDSGKESVLRLCAAYAIQPAHHILLRFIKTSNLQQDQERNQLPQFERQGMHVEALESF